jgi:hypothetical protein
MATVNEISEGLKILAKYADKEDPSIGGAAHDVIFGPIYGEIENLSDEDRNRLEELGWHFDSEYESWSHFV